MMGVINAEKRMVRVWLHHDSLTEGKSLVTECSLAHESFMGARDLLNVTASLQTLADWGKLWIDFSISTGTGG